MSRGKFISFEGGEGVGKSTQVRLLAQALEQRGIAAVVTREPGGTPGAESIRGLLLGKEVDWNPRAEALLFAAARSDHCQQRIGPALASGQWVLCDRFIDSTRAYQGGEGELSDADILSLHRVGSGGLMPDFTVLLSVPEHVAHERLRQRDGATTDRIGGRDSAFHQRVAARFREIADAEPGRFVSIDGAGDPAIVHDAILRAIDGAELTR